MKKIKILLVCLLLTIAKNFAYADELPVSTEINLSLLKTELKKDALGLIAKTVPKLNESAYFLTDKMVGYLGPTVEVHTGGNDSYESILAKVSGFMMPTPPKDTTDGKNEPDFIRSWLHVLPFSLGIESDTTFDTPVVLAEFGWTPIGPRTKIDPNNLDHSERFGLDPTRSFGLFAQAGYKFNQASDASQTGTTNSQGGNTDQSSEKPDKAIARIKAEIRYGFNIADAIQFIPSATGWYDIQNSVTYYKIESLMRINLVNDNKYSLDLRYNKGSGAPNFNKGDQFSTGLTIRY